MFIANDAGSTYLELRDQYQILQYKLEETIRTLDTLKDWVYNAIHDFNIDVDYRGRSYKAIAHLYEQCRLEFEMDNPFYRTYTANIEAAVTLNLQFEAETEEDAEKQMEELFSIDDVEDVLKSAAREAAWVSYYDVDSSDVTITVDEE